MDELITKYARHGIVARMELVSAGATRSQLRDAQHDGRLARLGRSWFATPEAGGGIVAAVSAHGSLTCLSALELLGIWTLDVGKDHHIRRAPRRRRDGPVTGAIECRSTLTARGAPVDSLDAAVVAAILNHSEEDGIVALDCLLHEKRRTRSELEDLLANAPDYAARLLARASGLVESPLESVLHYRLGRHNVRVRPQFTVPGAGRYDFLIGKRLLVEVDGFGHHRSRKQFREDRRRDRRANALGYKVLRFTWEDVMHSWPRVLREIMTFVSSDFHRQPPRSPGRRRSERSPAGSDAPTRHDKSTGRERATSVSIPRGGSGRGRDDDGRVG